MIPFIGGALVKSTETESKMVVPGAREEGTGELLLNGYRISVLHYEEFWKLVSQQCECT